MKPSTRDRHRRLYVSSLIALAVVVALIAIEAASAFL